MKKWQVEFNCARSMGHYTVEAIDAKEAISKAEEQLKGNIFCTQGIPCDCTTKQKHLKPQKIEAV